MNKLLNKTFDITKGKTVVFTDGSCFPNKACKESKAGYAASFVAGEFKDIIIYGNIENRPNYATNQRAEGMAIYTTLKYLDEHLDEWEECIIISDTKFWVEMFTIYMFGWDAKDLDFNEKKNPDMTIPMWNLYKKFCYEFGKTIDFRHMKSHNKDKWRDYPKDSYEYICYFNNDYVDQMASYARETLKPGTEIIENVEFDESIN